MLKKLPIAIIIILVRNGYLLSHTDIATIYSILFSSYTYYSIYLGCLMCMALNGHTQTLVKPRPSTICLNFSWGEPSPVATV